MESNPSVTESINIGISVKDRVCLIKCVCQCIICIEIWFHCLNVWLGYMFPGVKNNHLCVLKFQIL